MNQVLGYALQAIEDALYRHHEKQQDTGRYTHKKRPAENSAQPILFAYSASE